MCTNQSMVRPSIIIIIYKYEYTQRSTVSVKIPSNRRRRAIVFVRPSSGLCCDVRRGKEFILSFLS